MKNNYTVYKHTSPTGKSYIGITKDYPGRCTRHKSDTKLGSNLVFHRAIRKYSWESFKHEIITDNITKAEAIRLETLLIKELNTLVPNGYNMLSSAEGIACGEDRRKARIANRKVTVKGYRWVESKKVYYVTLTYLCKKLCFESFKLESEAKTRADYLMSLNDTELLREHSEYKANKQKRNKGYTFHKQNNNYVVLVRIEGKTKYFGSFKTEQEAIDRVEEVKLLTFS